MVATHKRRTNWQPHTDLPELAKKTPKARSVFSNALQKGRNRQEVRDCGAIRQVGEEGSSHYKPQLPNAMQLWLKHLAAHSWKAMFFNETLVIKWVPWLSCHETTREDKTMCLIYREAAPSLFLTIYPLPPPSSLHSLILFPILFLILPLKMSLL